MGDTQSRDSKHGKGKKKRDCSSRMMEKRKRSSFRVRAVITKKKGRSIYHEKRKKKLMRLQNSRGPSKKRRGKNDTPCPEIEGRGDDNRPLERFKKGGGVH